MTFFVILAPDTKLPTYLLTYLLTCILTASEVFRGHSGPTTYHHIKFQLKRLHLWHIATWGRSTLRPKF